MSVAIEPRLQEAHDPAGDVPRGRGVHGAAGANNSVLQRPTFRYASLDMWRGVACLLVVLCHSAPSAASFPTTVTVMAPVDQAALAFLKVLRYGSIGVPMFFVISGYCIAATARSAKQKQTSVGTYFWRRFRYRCPVVIPGARFFPFVCSD